MSTIIAVVTTAIFVACGLFVYYYYALYFFLQLLLLRY